MKRFGMSDKQYKRIAKFMGQKAQIEDDPKEDGKEKAETKDEKREDEKKEDKAEDKEKKEGQSGEWLPSILSEEESSLVSEIGQKLGWGLDAAFGFCVALLQDVNAHTEAQQVNDLLTGGLKKFEEDYEKQKEYFETQGKKATQDNQAWDLYEKCLEFLGPEMLLQELLLAMSTEEAIENFEFIMRMHEIPTTDEEEEW